MPTALFAVQEAARTHAHDTGLLTLRNHRSQGGQLAFFYFTEGHIYAVQVDGYEFSLVERLLNTGRVSSKIDMDNAIVAAGSKQSLSLPYILSQRQLVSFGELKSLLKDDFLEAAQIALSWENVKPSWSPKVNINYPIPSIPIDKLVEVLDKRQEKLVEVAAELNTAPDALLSLTAQTSAQASNLDPEEATILRLSQSGYPSLEDLAAHVGLTSFGIIRHSYELWSKGLLSLYNEGKNVSGEEQEFTFEREEDIDSILLQSSAYEGEEDSPDEQEDVFSTQSEAVVPSVEESQEEPGEISANLGESQEDLPGSDQSNEGLSLLNDEDRENNEPDEVDLSFIGAFTLDLTEEEPSASESSNPLTEDEEATSVVEASEEDEEHREIILDTSESSADLESHEEEEGADSGEGAAEREGVVEALESDESEAEVNDVLESPADVDESAEQETPQHFGADEIVVLEDEDAAPQLAVEDDEIVEPTEVEESPSAPTPAEVRLVSETVERVESSDSEDDVDLDFILSGMKKVAESQQKSSALVAELEAKQSNLESVEEELVHQLNTGQNELNELREQVKILEGRQETIAEDLKRAQEALADNSILLDREKSKSARFQEGLAQLQTLLGR